MSGALFRRVDRGLRPRSASSHTNLYAPRPSSGRARAERDGIRASSYLSSKALLLWVLFGCANDDDLVRIQVYQLAELDGERAAAAAARIAVDGHRALIPIEAALHTATPVGRKNLILALRRIGEVEAVPLLGHLARFDEAADVRREAEWTLKSWAAMTDARAARARQALRKLEERRGHEETG